MTSRRLWGLLGLLCGLFCMATVASDVTATEASTSTKVGPVEPLGFFVEQGSIGSPLVTLTSGSATYQVKSDAYANPLFIVELYGDNHYTMGHDYGQLMGKQMVGCYHAFFGYLATQIKNVDALTVFLRWQWTDYLSKEVPQKYIDEIQGMADGSGGLLSLAEITEFVTLANFPGDHNSNIFYLLAEEFADSEVIEKIIHDIFGNDAASLLGSHTKAELRALAIAEVTEAVTGVVGFMCSDLSAWGSRTEGGSVFFGRNLDWMSSTGISDFKTIAVYHPPEGHSHATVGFAALPGGLAGFNSEGISFGEAGLDVTNETFKGYPWLLRMRELLATSATLDEALDFWKSTNNTVGMNYVISSVNDAAAVALETMAGTTIVFHENDPARFAGKEMCESMPQAVYRTNHACGEETWRYMVVTPQPSSGTAKRWVRIVDTLHNYENQNISMDHIQWLNATAIPAMRGKANDYTCPTPEEASGSSVLSLATDLAKNLIWVAYEEGSKDAGRWTNAVCGTYFQLDVSQFFK